MRRVARVCSEQTAMALGISRKSVDNHKQRIFGKLRAHNAAHAVAREAEFADPPGDPTKVIVAEPSVSLRGVLTRTFDDVAAIDTVASVGSLSELLVCCPRVLVVSDSSAAESVSPCSSPARRAASSCRKPGQRTS